MIYTSRILPLSFIIFFFAFVSIALAHETPNDKAHMQMHAEASVGVNAQGNPIKPLDAIRRAKEVQGAINQNSMEAKAELRMETKANLQAAPPGEKRDVMKDAMGERRDINQDRNASSSALRMKVRDAFRQHGGLIRERFSLAIRQFEKMFTRIESRIEKMKAAGVATASVEAELEAAKTARAEAQADIDAVRAIIENVDDSSDRAAVKTELKAAISTAHTSIREAHQALQAVVRSLVTLAKENKPKADAAVSAEAEASVTTEASE